MVSFFCVLAPEGRNTIVFGRDGEGDRMLWLILILSPQCCHTNKMISPAIVVYDKFTTILWRYIIIFLLDGTPFEQVVDFWFSSFIFPKTIGFIPSGANKQKIKRIDHRKCNVRASKNAEQAFSTQWYLYSGYGLIVLFSSVSSNESHSKFLFA